MASNNEPVVQFKMSVNLLDYTRAMIRRDRERIEQQLKDAQALPPGEEKVQAVRTLGKAQFECDALARFFSAQQ